MTTMDSVNAGAFAAPTRSIRSLVTRTLVALLVLAATALLVARVPRPAASHDTATAAQAVDDGRPLLLPER